MTIIIIMMMKERAVQEEKEIKMNGSNNKIINKCKKIDRGRLFKLVSFQLQPKNHHRFLNVLHGSESSFYSVTINQRNF